MRVYARLDPQERILRHVSMEPMSGCWIWTGYVDQNGYGSTYLGFRADNTHRTAFAHRVAYLAFRGPIPPELELDHRCRLRCCVNPDHLEPVTGKINQKRGVNTPASRTHCPRGHEYNFMSTGLRYCRICTKESARRQRARKRGAA